MQQCRLAELPRSSWYYRPAVETPRNLALMRQIDELYLQHPFYGSRRMAEELGSQQKMTYPKIALFDITTPNQGEGSQVSRTRPCCQNLRIR